MASSDVTVSSFVISLDVIHSEFDQQMFLDYAKSTFKKSFFVINAGDYTESSGRQSRNDRSGNKPPSNATELFVKGVESKIQAELAKLVDAKRRLIATEQKRLAKGQSDKSLRSSRAAAKVVEEASLYQGEAEVVFCILNGPTTEQQLAALSGSKVQFGAFMSLVRTGDCLSESQSFVKDPVRKGSAARKKQAPPIEGDQVQLQVPPVRWTRLQARAQHDIVFHEIQAPRTIEESWTVLQREIGRIIKCRMDFEERFAQREFVVLPRLRNNVDMSKCKKLAGLFPENIVNAILGQLKENKWRLTDPPEPPAIQDVYRQAFQDIAKRLTRAKILVADEEKITEEFDSTYIPGFDFFYHIKRWEMNKDDAIMIRAVSLFYINLDNRHAVAGHRFDSMVSQANKRLMMGLPAVYFDWTKWRYSTEIADAPSTLDEVLRDYMVVDTFMEQPVGIMWVLALPPVSRSIGQAFVKSFMPAVLDGVSGWLTDAFEKEQQPERKGRFAQTPAQMIRDGEDLEGLLPNFIKRLSREDDLIYRLNASSGKVVDYTSPYFFDSGMSVHVTRAIVNGMPEFSYRILLKQNIEFNSSVNSIMVTADKTRFLFERGAVTLFMRDGVSLYIKDGQIVVQSKGEMMVLTSLGSVLFNYRKRQTGLTADGRIGYNKDGVWTWFDMDGSGYQKIEGVMTSTSQETRQLADIGTGITKLVRDDDVKFSRYDDGSRVIQWDDLVVNQVDDCSVFTRDTFPTITYRNDEYIVSADGFICVFGVKTGSAEITCDNCSYTYDGNIVSFNVFGEEGVLTPRLCQVKSGANAFYGHWNGTQRAGPLAAEGVTLKRKEEVIQTHWGRMQLVKETRVEADQARMMTIFRPRFFAVRKDLTATEYVHEHVLERYTKKTGQIVDINGESANLVTVHDPQEKPVAYVQYEVVDKRQRSIVLRNLQIPKPRRTPQTGRRDREVEDPQTILDQAMQANAALQESFNIIRNNGEAVRDKNHEEYLYEIGPKPVPQPDKVWAAMPTPDPRALMAQAAKYVEPEVSNYWDSPEGAFAMPLTTARVLPRPLSPRTQLYDLPRERRKTRDHPPKEPVREIRRCTPVTPRRQKSVYDTEVSRPSTAHTILREVDFGIVKAGETVVETIDILNSGRRPMRYRFKRPHHPDLRLITNQGVVMPGLSVKVEIELTATTAKVIGSSFTFETRDSDTKIPIYAKVVD